MTSLKKQGNSETLFKYHVGKTKINHPQKITINRWYKQFLNGWFIIVLPTLLEIT